MKIRYASPMSDCHDLEISIGRNVQAADVVNLTETRPLPRTLNHPTLNPTPNDMKKNTRLLSTLLVGTLLSFGLQPSAHAQTTLSYTNTADAWLTTNSWAPPNDWGTGTVKTNTTTAGVRLNIGTNSSGIPEAGRFDEFISVSE